jgi:hypothetical protein
MKTIAASAYPPSDWPRSGRLRKPYTFHRVRIVEGDATTAAPGPELPERDWQLAVHHLKGPINPYLLRLEHGHYPSIVRFVEQLGLDELTLWGASPDDRDTYLTEPWERLLADIWHLTDGVAMIPADHLMDAWSVGSQADAFREEQTKLREAFAYAAQSEGADQTIRFLRDYRKITHRSVGLESWSFPNPELYLTTWPVQPMDDEETLALVEAPAHIFARAWLELYDELQASGAPQICPRCNTPFIGSRRNQTYCTRDCQDRDYGQRRRRGEHRREYERMYQRKRRGTITSDEFETWKKRQGRK